MLRRKPAIRYEICVEVVDSGMCYTYRKTSDEDQARADIITIGLDKKLKFDYIFKITTEDVTDQFTEKP